MQIELVGPQRTAIGSIPLHLSAATNRSIQVPFRVPRITPAGHYALVLTTVTADGVLQSSATLTVLP